MAAHQGAVGRSQVVVCPARGKVVGIAAAAALFLNAVGEWMLQIGPH